jgi:hypothetical protein
MLAHEVKAVDPVGARASGHTPILSVRYDCCHCERVDPTCSDPHHREPVASEVIGDRGHIGGGVTTRPGVGS